MGLLRIDFCVGTANPSLKKQLITALSRMDFQSACSGASIPEVLRALRQVQPWVAVNDVALPPGNIGQLAQIIEEDGLAAMLFIGRPLPDLKNYTTLPWPVEPGILKVVIHTLCQEFARKKKLQEEIGILKQKLADRKGIEKARGLLMKSLQLDEEAAFRHLRRISMERQTALPETARAIISELDGGKKK